MPPAAPQPGRGQPPASQPGAPVAVAAEDASADETTSSPPVGAHEAGSTLAVVETGDGGLEQIRWAIVGLLGAALLVALATLMGAPAAAAGLAQVVILIALAAALVVHQRTLAAATERRLAREASVTRILQGLSRSVSPESVVDAIVQELHAAAGADHVVVARVRQPDQVVEVTLVAASAAVPVSKTYLRPDIVAEPVHRCTSTGACGTPSRSGPGCACCIAGRRRRDRPAGPLRLRPARTRSLRHWWPTAASWAR